MSPRVLSLASPLLSLFFFSAFVVALFDVSANCTLPSFSWSFNSIGQSPCMVAANMLAPCYSGTYSLTPLPSGWVYRGPNSDYPNGCQCSTIGYSLISACSACQGNQPLDWAAYVGNCTSTLPPSRFPYPVPAGIRVPHWAILDVTQEYNWDSEQARQAGDTPEYGPGAIFGASGVYTSGVSTSSTSASSTPSSKLSHSGGHAGPIAGGVIGGIAIISIAVAAIFYIRRRRSQAANAGVDYCASQPTLNDGTVTQSPSMKFYDPVDRTTTFSGYQGGPQSLDISPTSQVPFSSHVGSGSALTNMSTSLPHARGYHGLPMPSA